MVHRYSFIPVFSFILSSLAWWSTQVEPAHNFGVIEFKPAFGGELQAQITKRIELIETLDKLVDRQHYYHSIYGHYEKDLGHTGFSVNPKVAEGYEIKVIEATKDHLLVNASAESNGKLLELVSIDQDYQLQASFEVPDPRPSYLKEKAILHLKNIKNAPKGQALTEEGVFRGYFNYKLEKDQNGEKNYVAVGVKAPVVGVQLELNNFSFQFSDHMANSQLTTGQDHSLGAQAFAAGNADSPKMSVESEQYAKKWNEVSKIVQYNLEKEPMVSKIRVNRKVSSSVQRKNLEFEPVTPEE